MVAYSFKPSFVPKIEARTKQQTIRRPRKRDARPGEQLQFFTGPRMRPTRVGFARCFDVREVRLDFTHGRVEFPATGAAISTIDDLDAFAARDGFDHPSVSAWLRMQRWWATTHPDAEIFLGTLIDWRDSFSWEPSL